MNRYEIRAKYAEKTTTDLGPEQGWDTRSSVYHVEPWSTRNEATLGELYSNLKDELGGHVSKMYHDTETGSEQVGWVFSRREQYDDCAKKFLREVWVEVRCVEYSSAFATAARKLAAV